MTRVDATHWTLTLTGKEGTQVQYKYVLGDWNYVEKGPCPTAPSSTTARRR